MTYTSLDTIPYKTFLKIAETNDVSLLSNTDQDIIDLTDLWNRLYDEHLEKNHTAESERIFRIEKDITILKVKHDVVILACTALRFEFDQQVYDIVLALGYDLSIKSTEEYYHDMEVIERQANAYLIKINRLKEQLPTPNEENKYTIDDVMASYSSILGFDFDYNQISYNKYHALQNQVNLKIKSIKDKQNMDG